MQKIWAGGNTMGVVHWNRKKEGRTVTYGVTSKAQVSRPEDGEKRNCGRI